MLLKVKSYPIIGRLPLQFLRLHHPKRSTPSQSCSPVAGSFPKCTWAPSSVWSTTRAVQVSNCGFRKNTSSIKQFRALWHQAFRIQGVRASMSVYLRLTMNVYDMGFIVKFIGVGRFWVVLGCVTGKPGKPRVCCEHVGSTLEPPNAIWWLHFDAFWMILLDPFQHTTLSPIIKHHIVK